MSYLSRFLSVFCLTLPIIAGAETIYLTGSEAAANYLKNNLGDFEQQSGHQLIFDTSSTADGYESTKEGHLGLVSRPPLAHEENDKLVLTEIGKEACLVIVNFHNPLSSITQAQVKNIFSGTVGHWLDIHKGFNYEFERYGPSPEADSYTLIENTLDIESAVYNSVVTIENKDKKTLRYIAIKPGGIGLVTESAWKAELITRSEYVKVLYVDGIEAKPKYVKSGFYPLAIPVYLAANRSLTKAEQELIEFLTK